jgi:NADPH:quinone reductase-like Zn-dependent oxidoreductase
MVLGCDAAGIDSDGNEVVVHGVISSPDWRGDETLDPKRTLLSERYPGTFAELVRVPRRNLVPKPAGLSMVQAACLPTAWLTAYRMLFVQSGLKPGDTVLVQGAGGGVASAVIVLARAAGMRVLATSRDAAKRLRLRRSARTRPSSRAPAFRGESTRSWRRWARPPGHTRSSRYVQAELW